MQYYIQYCILLYSVFVVYIQFSLYSILFSCIQLHAAIQLFPLNSFAGHSDTYDTLIKQKVLESLLSLFVISRKKN